MNQVSVMVASHFNPEGAYLTTFALLEQLENSNLEWEIVLVFDGGDPCKWEQAHPNIRVLRLTGSNRTGSPQGTRDAGIRVCRYPNVLCVDSHVVVFGISEWVKQHVQLNATLSFPAMIGGSSEMWKMYGSVFDWEGSFWYKHVLYQPKQWEPYKIVETSHSGFMVSRPWYLESGGYTNLQVGYGAEETFLGLKSLMLGGNNYLIPTVAHAHYQPAGRNEGAESTDNYKRNFLVAAYVFGGEKYLRKAEAHYHHQLAITPDIQRERVKICAGPYHGDLDALRLHLDKEGII